VSWHTSVIPALRRLRQEDHEFEASLVYILRSCLQKEKKKMSKTITTATTKDQVYFAPRPVF
jgi:hypothetical protein